MNDTSTSILEDIAFDNNSLGNDADNSTFHTDPDELYDVPIVVIVFLGICYGSISILAIAGNSLVIYIVATSKRMQNVTNCFIANLALADTVIGLFVIPFQFQAALLQRWNLPYFMCGFCPFVQVLCVNVSVFTLTAIALDRYRAILRPLSAKPTKLVAKLAIAGIWMTSGILAIPMAVALRVIIVADKTPGGRIIQKPFCSPTNMSQNSMLVYRGVLAFLQYLTPLSIISCVYARMGMKLWGSRAPGNAEGSRDATLMKNKKKVIKMLAIVVILFALCWLPLQTYNVLQFTFPNINEYRYINIIWFSFDWLAMSNSCYNPFIYGIYNEKFKREFQQRCPFGSRKWSNSVPTDSLDMEKTLSTKAFTRYGWKRSSGGYPAMSFYRGVSMREPVRIASIDEKNESTLKNGTQKPYIHNGLETTRAGELFVFPSGEEDSPTEELGV